jgi:SAM-dependent methyltransferase
MDLSEYFRKILLNKYLPVPCDIEIFTGGDAQNFLQIGVAVLADLIQNAELHENSRVIEIGSGIGRVAVPMTQWLESGHYAGFEIVPAGVEWCRREVTSKYPNFKFEHIDVYNEGYNPTGSSSLQDFALRAPFGQYDVAVFCSVFTHLIAIDAETYFRLMAEHVAPGGYLWSTWFLMDAEARDSVKAGKSSLSFILRDERTFHLDEKGVSTAAVAFDADYLRSLFRENGFSIELEKKVSGVSAR